MSEAFTAFVFAVCLLAVASVFSRLNEIEQRLDHAEAERHAMHDVLVQEVQE